MILFLKNPFDCSSLYGIKSFKVGSCMRMPYNRTVLKNASYQCKIENPPSIRAFSKMAGPPKKTQPRAGFSNKGIRMDTPV